MNADPTRKKMTFSENQTTELATEMQRKINTRKTNCLGVALTPHLILMPENNALHKRILSFLCAYKRNFSQIYV